MRRVVVTGAGALTALGAGRRALWQELVAGRSGIREITLVDPARLRVRNGAEVPAFSSEEHFDNKALELLDRASQLLIVAAREAVEDAGLEAGPLGPRAAVLTGCSLGGQTTEDDLYLDLYGRGRKRVPPLTIPRVMANAGASHVSMELGATGPSLTLSTACSSSTHAIGLALWMIRQGTVDLALAGGSEAPFTFANLKAWEALRVVAPDTCRPFSAERRGMILGEGAAMLVLETEESARGRGAEPLAEIAGFGMSSDAHHITQPSAAGPAQALEAALADAGLEPADIGYVNAHGTGTLANDPTEARALHDVFGEHTASLAVSSTKGAHGHALGAAGAIEALATVLALREGALPPTANFLGPDPECDLDVVPNEAREATVDAALSSSFAFGGTNAVLALRRWAG